MKEGEKQRKGKEKERCKKRRASSKEKEMRGPQKYLPRRFNQGRRETLRGRAEDEEGDH